MEQIKIELRSKDLLKAFAVLSAAIPANPLVPLYAYVKFEVYNGSKRIFLTATDSKITVKAFLEASSVEIFTSEKSFCLTYTDSKALLGSLPDAPISLVYSSEGVNFDVNIISQTHDYKLTGEDAKLFPETKQTGTDHFVIDAAQLKEGIGYLQPIIPPSKDTEFRPYLAGIYFDFKPDYVTLVAFDGNMSLAIFETDIESPGFASFTLPSRAVKLLWDILSNGSDPVGFTLSEKQVSIEYGNVYLTATLMEGNFPPYKAVVTPDPMLTATVDIDLWKPALTRAMIFSDSNREALHAFQEDLLFITSEDVYLSKKSSQDISLEDRTGDSLEICLNGDKLLKLLSSVGGPGQVEIKKAHEKAVVPSMYISTKVNHGRSASFFIMPIVRNNQL